jgi:hypothetical protein
MMSSLGIISGGCGGCITRMIRCVDRVSGGVRGVIRLLVIGRRVLVACVLMLVGVLLSRLRLCLLRRPVGWRARCVGLFSRRG